MNSFILSNLFNGKSKHSVTNTCPFLQKPNMAHRDSEGNYQNHWLCSEQTCIRLIIYDAYCTVLNSEMQNRKHYAVINVSSCLQTLWSCDHHYTAFVIKQEVLINDHQTKSKLNNVFKIRQPFYKICFYVL